MVSTTPSAPTLARREFLRSAALMLAAAPFYLPAAAEAYSANSRIASMKHGAAMSQTTLADSPLTVMLVHGAFADASSWTGVIGRLQASGVAVTAPANPLRGISIDTAYLASVLDQIPGPVQRDTERVLKPGAVTGDGGDRGGVAVRAPCVLGHRVVAVV